MYTQVCHLFIPSSWKVLEWEPLGMMKWGVDIDVYIQSVHIYIYVVWYGMVWYGIVWYGMVWYYKVT